MEKLGAALFFVSIALVASIILGYTHAESLVRSYEARIEEYKYEIKTITEDYEEELKELQMDYECLQEDYAILEQE